MAQIITKEMNLKYEAAVKELQEMLTKVNEHDCHDFGDPRPYDLKLSYVDSKGNESVFEYDYIWSDGDSLYIEYNIPEKRDKYDYDSIPEPLDEQFVHFYDGQFAYNPGDDNIVNIAYVDPSDIRDLVKMMKETLDAQIASEKE